jgi:deoxyadenosine/deoxycytidine kinase
LATRLAAAVPARLIVEQPDWPQLDAFYADPARHGMAMELAFLRQRAGLLRAAGENEGSLDSSGPMETVPLRRSWTVSDFWFDQSAAFAKAWLPPEQLPAFLEHYAQLRREVVRPKLIVCLDSPAEQLLARVRQRGRACERHLTAEQLDRTGQAVREQALQPDLGPVLHANQPDPESIFTEVLAAVRAME